MRSGVWSLFFRWECPMFPLGSHSSLGMISSISRVRAVSWSFLPLATVSERAHNPSRAYVPTKRYSAGFLAFGPPLDLVMWGLELRQPLTIRKETSLSLRTAQEGGRAERCKETQFGCYYSNLWIKLQWKPVQSSECLSIWANKPKVIPLKSSSQKQTNNELMLTWHLQS